MAERLWAHSLGSAGPTVAVSPCTALPPCEGHTQHCADRLGLAQVTDHLFNWTLDRFDLSCSSLTGQGKLNMVDRSAKLNHLNQLLKCLL